MEERDFARLRGYMAKGQEVRLNTEFFTPRERSGIVNSIKQGYWLSNGKIAWLAADLAESYGLPLIRMKQGSYGGLYWNKTAGKQEGMKEALTSLLAYQRLTNLKMPSWQINDYERAISNPAEHEYVRATEVTEIVRSQFAKLNKDHKTEIEKFLYDWERNDVWINIS